MDSFREDIKLKHCSDCNKETNHEIASHNEQICLACGKFTYFLDRPFYNQLVQEHCVKCNRSTTQSRGNDITMCKECGYFVDSKTGINKDTIKDCYDSAMLLDLHSRFLKNF